MSTLLLRFREKTYAVVTDIKKTFLQIGVYEKDRDMTRLCWLNNTIGHTSELITYRFRANLFGATCSPFILNTTLLKHVHEHFSRTAESLKSGLYVDNIISGFENARELLELYMVSRDLMNKGGFNLRSWASNCDEINKLTILHNVNDGDEFVKVLGLRWNVKEDHLYFGYKPLPKLSQN